MVLTVHHLDNSRSQRILWLLDEFEVPYEIVRWQRDSEDHAPEGLKQVHPLGLAPIIVDGDTTIAESGTIVEYLLRKYGKQPGTLSETAHLSDLYFTHYAEGSLMPILIGKMICQRVPEKAPLLLKPFLRSVFDAVGRRMIDPRLETHREYIETQLSKSEGGFLAGGSEPTAADFMMIFPLELWGKMFPESFGPRCREYVDRIHERPGFKRVRTIVDPNACLLIPPLSILNQSVEKGGEYHLL